MKFKKNQIIILIAVISIICVGIVIALLGANHKHSFGEWKTKTAATCEIAEIEARRCKCGEEETREGEPATGHTFLSITAVSNMEKPMAGLTVEADDLSVTAICACGKSVAVTDAITVENATLTLGMNTVTVKYGDLSTTIDIEAVRLDVVLDGTVADDTHISSESKDHENSSKKEMGTKVDTFRSYLRVNLSEIINTSLLTSNKDKARVQLVLSVTGGRANDETTFKLRTYAPAAGTTDVDFSKLTWNDVDKDGTYGALNWSNGAVLIDAGVGHNVSVENNKITITLAYSQIADFIDENGNILFAFATNTKGLKIGSLENKTEENRPVVRIALIDEHFHVFDQKVTENKYFASANCKERVNYYVSCACGETGTETFAHGEVLDHAYGEAIPEKEPTCTKGGNNKYYQCKVCNEYFLDKEGTLQTTKDAQKIEALGHAYTSISAVSNLEDPMATMVVKASDLSVTGTCGRCGENTAIVEGIEIEGATLALGKNTVTVKYGALSTELTIEATELHVVINGVVTDDTYVYSSGKSKEYTDKEELGTYSSLYRAYLRVNVSDIVENELFLANQEEAKLQLILTVTSGSVIDSTTTTLKAYAPAAGETDVLFSDLTWNSVDNKEDSAGKYSALNWNNGAALTSGVCAENGKIIIELSYHQLTDYIDENGNILFVFATNTSGLKVGSLENATESNKPAFKAVISGVSP